MLFEVILPAGDEGLDNWTDHGLVNLFQAHYFLKQEGECEAEMMPRRSFLSTEAPAAPAAAVAAEWGIDSSSPFAKARFGLL